MNATFSSFDDQIVHFYGQIVNHYLPSCFVNYEYTPWIYSLLGSVVIGLSGILPLAIMDEYKNRK